MGSNHPSGGDEELPAEAGTPVENKQAKAAEEEANKTYKERQLALASASNRLTESNVWITRVLAVFTALGAGAAIYQGYVANKSAIASQVAAEAAIGAVKIASDTLAETQRSNARQAEISEQARKDASDAAHSSAAAASNALQASIYAFHTEQRAWLGTTDLRLTSLQAGSPLRAEMKLPNNGNTPAFHISADHEWIATSPFKRNVGEWVRSGALPKSAERPPTEVIWPHDSAVLPFATFEPISQADVDAIRGRRYFVYVFGDIHYSDAFGGRHLTRFCGVYDPPTGRFDICEYAKAD